MKLESYYGEEWKKAPDQYNTGRVTIMVSNFGRIARMPKGKISECKNKQNIIRLNGIVTRLPYVVLETFVGPRPAGMWCTHKNGNHHDNRLENLKWDTPRNTGRMKLDDKQVFKIRRAYESGERTITQLAQRYRVSTPTIHDIVNGRTWKWIP